MQADRLSSLGQLSASVAHEINNPLSGVLNLSMLMQRILKDDGIPKGREAEFRKYLDQVATETARTGRIVSDLLAFSRRSKPHRSDVDLNAVIGTTLSLVSHKLKLMNVEVDVRPRRRSPAPSRRRLPAPAGRHEPRPERRGGDPEPRGRAPPRRRRAPSADGEGRPPRGEGRRRGDARPS